MLYNDNGTAPGDYYGEEREDDCDAARPSERNDSHVPKNQVKPLSGEEAGIYLCFRILRVAEVGESAMEERVKDIIDAQTNPTIAPYAKDGEAILRITAKARDEEEANRLIDPIAAALKERLVMRSMARAKPIWKPLWQNSCCKSNSR